MNSLQGLTQLDSLQSIASKDDVFLRNKIKGISEVDSTKLVVQLRSIVQELLPSLTSASASNDSEPISITFQLSRVVYQLVVATKHRPQGFLELLTQCSHLLDVVDGESAGIAQFRSMFSLALERFYLGSESNSDEFVPDILKFLVLESLKIGGKETLVKRLYNIRGGFHVIDLYHDGSQWIRNLLLRTFASPLFLKNADGMNFLAFLLQFFPDLFMNQVSTLIRNNLVVSVGSLRDAAKIYGQLLQKTLNQANKSSHNSSASSTASDAKVHATTIATIEETIQNFLHDAVYAADHKYFAGLRLLIKAFHDVSRPVWLEVFLVRIFDPIIWRALKCANAKVRLQAAQLFLDVFPLQKPAASPEECDAMVQKQFDQLAHLLKDADHKVRAMATRGVCGVLRDYWAALPASTTLCLLRFLADTLAVDTASTDVRVSVMTGLRELLQQPLAHSTLKSLLPLLASSLYDKAEKVRLEFIRILIEVKDLRELHFYDIVSVDALFARLVHERDYPEIVAALCTLLRPSFFPQSISTSSTSSVGADHVSRCLQLATQSLPAAEVFYGQLHLLPQDAVPIGVVAKFAALLSNTLAQTTQRLQQSIVDYHNEQQQQALCHKKWMKRTAVKRGRNGKKPNVNDILDDGDEDEETVRVSQHAVAELLLLHETLRDEVFCLLRVLSAVLRGCAEVLRDEAPSVGVVVRFVTASRLMQVVQSTSAAVDNQQLDLDVCLSVIDTATIVSRLAAVHQTYEDNTATVSEWKETFSLEFVLSVLMQAIVSPSLDDTSGDVKSKKAKSDSAVSMRSAFQQKFSESALDLFCVCHAQSELVREVTLALSVCDETASNANRVSCLSLLLQALCNRCGRDIPSFIENQLLRDQLNLLQQQYFVWREQLLPQTISHPTTEPINESYDENAHHHNNKKKNKIAPSTSKQQQEHPSKWSQATVRLPLHWQHVSATLFKSILCLAICYTTAQLNAEERAITEQEETVAFAYLDACITHAARMVGSHQERVLTILCLVDAVHVVGECHVSLLLKRLSSLMLPLAGEESNGVAWRWESEGPRFCLRRVSVLLSALVQLSQHQQQENLVLQEEMCRLSAFCSSQCV